MQKESRRQLFIGRWSPFHKGHAYIIQQAIDKGDPVVIAVRDTPLSSSDPYTLEQRLEMISAAYKDEDVVVIPIPDIKGVNIGRKVGYEINRYDAPAEIEGISATEIRKLMVAGDKSWKEKVPAPIAEYLERLDNKNGLIIWLTGLSGAGKSTLAEKIAMGLKTDGKIVKILDGDEVRTNITADLGFSKEDRDENIKRISYVAKCIADCQGIAIVAAISPYQEARQKAKDLIGKERFIEIYVKCDLDILKKRDTKGLYARAMTGEIKNFTGISDPYEVPENPDVVVDTGLETCEDCVAKIERFIKAF